LKVKTVLKSGNSLFTATKCYNFMYFFLEDALIGLSYRSAMTIQDPAKDLAAA